jgi:hypothetical protein
MVRVHTNHISLQEREPVTCIGREFAVAGPVAFPAGVRKTLQFEPAAGRVEGARKVGEARGMSLAITFLISIALRFCGEFGLCCIRPGRFWA